MGQVGVMVVLVLCMVIREGCPLESLLGSVCALGFTSRLWPWQVTFSATSV